MKKAFVFFAEGFEEVEALTIVDVLRRAEISTLMISITKNLLVEGAHGIRVMTDVIFEDVDFSDAEVLILPGGLPGADNLNAHSGLRDQLLQFAKEGQKIAAICAAPLVLGGLEILKDKEAVCYPGFEDKLTGAQLKYDPALKSGNIFTGRGPGTALDFSLLLVSELKGEDIANQLARGMLVQTW